MTTNVWDLLFVFLSGAAAGVCQLFWIYAFIIKPRFEKSFDQLAEIYGEKQHEKH